MDDDARRVDAALVRIAQLRPDQAGPRRGLSFDRRDHGARDFGRRQTRHRGGMRYVHGVHERAEALALLRGNEVRLGKAEEAELPEDLGLHAGARFLVRRIPLVDGKHHRAAALEDVAGDVGVLLGHAVGDIHQQHRHVGGLDRLQRLDDGEELRRRAGFASAAHASGIDQRIAAPAALERHLDRIARRTRLIEGDDALLADQGVDQRRLADVWPTDDSDARMALVCLVRRVVLGKRLERRFEQLAHAFAMRCGDRRRRADAKLVEFRNRRVRRHALGLVDRKPDARMAAQTLGDVAVRGCQAGTAIDDEDHRVGLGDRLLCLARHLDRQSLVGARLEAAGVDGDEAAAARAPLAVMAIARHARQVVHDRVTALRQAVKEGRFADVRAPDQREHRFHSARACNAPFCVCTSRAPGTAVGAARTAPPLVAYRATKAPVSRARKCT